MTSKNLYRESNDNGTHKVFPVLGVGIDHINSKTVNSEVVGKAIQKKSGFYCFANVHMVIEAQTNPNLFNSLEFECARVLADGFPVAKSLKALYGIDQKRIPGMGFLPSILEEANRHSLSIFLFGSTEEVLEKAIERIKRELKNIRIAGSISPPFNKEWPVEEYIKIIKETQPNIVIVALGCPKQEIWMASNVQKISAPLLGLGGALSVYAGLINRAPKWMQWFGLEWLFRLMQEPGRLWKRYLVTNSLYVFYVTRQWFQVRILGKKSL